MANNTDWLNISQLSGGTGETPLSLTALTNNTLSAKTATIKAYNSTYNVSGTSTVTIQGFVPTLTLSRSTVRFDSTGGTATFTVYSNTAWTITYPALVHSYSVSAGTGNTEVTIALGPNEDTVPKIDTGIVKDCFNVNQLYLTIVQESFISELTVTPADDIEFDKTGSTTSVTVVSNCDWDIELPSWVSASTTTGESGTTVVTFTAGENGPTDRSGEIVFYYGSNELHINVFQPLYIPAYITVTPSAYTYPYSASTYTFVVDSYPEWTAEVISTGETVWTGGSFLEVTFEIPSAMTMPLYTSNGGNITEIYVNAVRYYSTAYTFPSSGTYKATYVINETGSTPSFANNTYITKVYLSEGIKELYYMAFNGCSSLSSITSDALVAPTIEYRTFRGVASFGNLNYPAGSDYSLWLSKEEYYLGYYFWNGIMPEGIWVGQGVFNVTSTTEPVTIYGNAYTLAGVKENKTGKITYIPRELNGGYDYVFSSTGKQSIDFFVRAGNSVLDFYNVTALTDLITYDKTPIFTQLGCDVGGVTNLTAVTLNMNTGFAGGNGIGGILKRVTFSGKVSSVDSYSLLGSALTDAIFSTEVDCVLPNNTFYGCSSLSSVTMNDRVIDLGNSCFRNCTSLSSITLSNSITAISQYCFRDCTALSSITLPNSLKVIHNVGFMNCTSLAELTIPSSVTTMNENSLFFGCSSLRKITSLATTAPSVTVRDTDYRTTFYGIAKNGTLFYPSGSDYSTWIGSDNGWNLARFGWTGQEI